MRHISDYIALFIRMSAGLLLVTIGFQPLDTTGLHGLSPVIPVCLHSTNVLVLDVMLRALFVVFGLAILLGVRTRLLSAFMLSVTLLAGSICIQTPGALLPNHLMLFVLIMGLSVLVLRGGGIYAMRTGGWKNIPL